VILGLAATVLIGATPASDESSGLNLADLSGYRAALERPTQDPAVAVSFRDLWKNPKAFEGKRVRIEGRLARQFRQGAYGTFPPLVEAWVYSPSGDPFCVVYPAGTAHPLDGTKTIRFEGTFLRLLRYKAEDAPRLAPLIVGPAPPEPTGQRVVPRAIAKSSTEWLDWTVGIGAAIVAAAVLGTRHLRGAPRAPRSAVAEPAPQFREPDDPDFLDRDGTHGTNER
jgi:hypothetical protein